MKILAIDSSNLVMGISIATEEKVLAELITNSKKNHSERLMPAIAQMTEAIGIRPEELDRIVVAYGPGSYTGLRIGVTIAKTLAWTLKKELVGVSSLEIVAQNGRYFNGYIAPFFDARRGQVFAGLYRSSGGRVESVAADQLLLMKDWLPKLEHLDQPVLFLSNDLSIWREALEKYQWAHLGTATQNSPRPGELARLGLEKEPVSDIHHFLPVYLRMAEAEAKWLANQER
ncbi:tRNA (adenosine(37)-N6)-threonylcarbamoyltransferase complex dimerization subunit type 1 TsaB [Sporolactobacillus spathodeae]|uniref:tRNA threonylcarbamoyladenosine biosynthesis protein TsaB n=1 Tax=Sporolactobacillus spathodeae TaxID=1465502 RepID=A0ABS2QD06_9BACL|nr:tRNA (adenosine(37)-N6)-threonylcarbamoyltransferase complex dimerization subunit type 1 TsaB [Sporolactobacillus spathodeae]MBM7659195.1 tRNA threonylcarbamoyladenosine biosynthesis protein TsaB [Sporolactobacillus spathodeae]